MTYTTTVGRIWSGRPKRITSIVGIGILGVWIAIAILAPVLAPYRYSDIVGDAAYSSADSGFLLGTDYLGRDVFSRLLYGARLTLGLAAVTTALAFVGGVLLGGAAGVFHGRFIDTILSRTNDALMSFPSIMLALIV